MFYDFNRHKRPNKISVPDEIINTGHPAQNQRHSKYTARKMLRKIYKKIRAPLLIMLICFAAMAFFELLSESLFPGPVYRPEGDTPKIYYKAEPKADWPIQSETYLDSLENQY